MATAQELANTLRDRLVVKVWFPGRALWIKFVGTHKRYDQIDVTTL